MRQNPKRRAELLDAAIEVLAREGSRGLTLRAVDAEAGVPNGTASNYFANRGEMLVQVLRRTLDRLAPEPTELAETMEEPPSRDLIVTLMRELVGRARRERSCHMALLELRLEATRRPELRHELTRALGAELEANVGFHLAAGLPGDRSAVVHLYLAMSGLVVEDLTVPDVLAKDSVEDLVESLVRRLLPSEPA
jgi:AcrR family transcriptional regulator